MRGYRSRESGILKEIVAEKLKIAVAYENADEHNYYAELLSGKPAFMAPMTDPVSGDKVHCIGAVMSAFYDYHKARPEKRIDVAMYEALKFTFETETFADCIRNAIDCLIHHMVAQKQGHAPLSMDADALLRVNGANIKRYREVCRSGMTESLENYNKTIHREFGKSFM